MSNFTQNRTLQKLVSEYDSNFSSNSGRRSYSGDKQARCYPTFQSEEAAEYYVDCAAAVPQLIRRLQEQDEVIALLTAQVNALSQRLDQVQALGVMAAAKREEQAHRRSVLEQSERLDAHRTTYRLRVTSDESTASASSSSSTASGMTSAEQEANLGLKNLVASVNAHCRSAASSQRARSLADAVEREHKAALNTELVVIEDLEGWVRRKE